MGYAMKKITLDNIVNDIDDNTIQNQKEGKTHRCPHCGKTFVTKDALRDHVKAVHSDKTKKKKLKVKNTDVIQNNYTIGIIPKLLPGEGRKVKGIFNKKTFLNFYLLVELKNPMNFKIKSLVAEIKCGQSYLKKQVTPNVSTKIDIETNSLSVTAKITCIYKIGLFSTKTSTSSISRNFCA